MPNVAKVLKEEISRIARKEGKLLVSRIRGPAGRRRRDIADIKRRLLALEKNAKACVARLARLEGTQAVAAAAKPAERGWISGKGIRSLRKRLGLSQADFAKLVNASAQAVYVWESKPGTLKLRQATKAAVFAVRDIGAKEARRRLAETAKPAKSARKKGKRRA
jgi:DNA-binding transcriptional regulator YiaG